MAPTFEPASNLKDPAKIEASIQKQKERYLERAALDWKTAQVVLIGVGDEKSYAPITGTEKEILEQFFSIVANSIDSSTMMGGHNVKGFDLPLLVNRARAIGVMFPQSMLTLWNGRPQWRGIFFDTLEIISFGDRQRIEGNGVEDVCKALGVPGKSGDGAEFPALWKSNRDAAIAYNKQDVLAEISIAKACGIKF
jgi:predicted PolB exonuclease-like 3'-5' exonuclease